MAKRYKKKSNNKKKFLRYSICLIIIFIIGYAIYYFFIRKEDGQEEIMHNEQIVSENIENNFNEEKSDNDDNNKESENNSNNENISLNCDVLIPKDLDNEVRSNFENKIKDSDVVRIHYKLKILEEGTAQLYYKLNNTKLFTVTVDIASKSIINSEEIKDEELAEKPAIVDNLEEDVKNDFETYKDKLNGVDSRLNIIISNTEIVINVSYES